MSVLRVMTYNIRRGGQGGGLLDQAVRSAAPDVLLVNEAPKFPFLWRRRCRRLAERWGMTYLVGGRSAGSNMIVSGDHVKAGSTYQAVLPQPLFQPRRGIAAAQLEVDDMLLGVVSCHLSLDQGRRLSEVERVIHVANRLRGAVVVVAGDLNERPVGSCWKRLRDEGFVDHGTAQWPTFPAEAPRKRIDALLVRGPVQVLHHGDPGVDEALQERASDHRPVLALLEL